MIVNLQSTGWEIIYHRAHALLAAQIAGFWEFGQEDYRLYETISALSHHDDLEKEWEGDQLTEAGAPLDFTLERQTSVEQLRRHADEALYRGRWVALLISMHLCFLNQSQSEEDTAMGAFLQTQRQRQAQWREELGVSQDETTAAYDFMRWCDRLSLILCQRQIPSAGRSLEITRGPKGKNYTVHRSASGNVGIAPWPFAANEFTVSVEACYLSQLQYGSNDELTKSLKQAPRKLLSWTLAGN